MGRGMKENLIKMTYMAKELMCGQIKGFTKGSGEKTRCMGTVKLFGKMDGNIQE